MRPYEHSLDCLTNARNDDVGECSLRGNKSTTYPWAVACPDMPLHARDATLTFVRVCRCLQIQR